MWWDDPFRGTEACGQSVGHGRHPLRERGSGSRGRRVARPPVRRSLVRREARAWAGNKRSRAATLGPERVKQLSAIGMRWTDVAGAVVLAAPGVGGQPRPPDSSATWYREPRIRSARTTVTQSSPSGCAGSPPSGCPATWSPRTCRWPTGSRSRRTARSVSTEQARFRQVGVERFSDDVQTAARAHLLQTQPARMRNRIVRDWGRSANSGRTSGPQDREPSPCWAASTIR